MAATTDDLRKNIQPGSVPFGQRQGLEAGLGQLPSQANPRAATAMSSGLGIPSNPLDPLTQGQIPVGPDELTSGLSVGPGPGPAQAIPDDRIHKLRLMAMNAKSPVLREMARSALRSTVRMRRNG